MIDRTGDELEAELAKVEASRKEHAVAWLELDKRRTRRRDWAGAWSIISLIGLLITAGYSSPAAIHGAVVGMAVAGSWWWLTFREGQLAKEMEKRFWQQREADLQCAAIRVELTRSHAVLKRPEVASLQERSPQP